MGLKEILKISPVILSLSSFLAGAKPPAKALSIEDDEIHEEIFKKRMYSEFEDNPKELLKLKALVDRFEESRIEGPVIMPIIRPTPVDVDILYNYLESASNGRSLVEFNLSDTQKDLLRFLAVPVMRTLKLPSPIGLATIALDGVVENAMKEVGEYSRLSAIDTLERLDRFAFKSAPETFDKIFDNKDDASLMFYLEAEFGKEFPFPTLSSDKLLKGDKELKSLFDSLDKYNLDILNNEDEGYKLIDLSFEGLNRLRNNINIEKNDLETKLREYDGPNIESLEEFYYLQEGAKYGIDAWSSIISVIDPEVGRTISKVENSLSQIVGGIASVYFSQGATAFQSFGNIAQGVGGLVSGFSGDDVEGKRFEMMMREMRAIKEAVYDAHNEIIEARKDIEWLHRDNNKHFYEIESQLIDIHNTIYLGLASMQNSMDRLETRESRIEGLGRVNVIQGKDTFNLLSNKVIKEQTLNIQQLAEDYITTNASLDKIRYLDLEVIISRTSDYVNEIIGASFNINGGAYSLEYIQSEIPETIRPPQNIFYVSGMVPEIFSENGIYRIAKDCPKIKTPASHWRNYDQAVRGVNLFNKLLDRYHDFIWENAIIEGNSDEHPIKIIEKLGKLEDAFNELEIENDFLRNPTVFEAAIQAYEIALKNFADAAQKDLVEIYGDDTNIKRSNEVSDKLIKNLPHLSGLFPSFNIEYHPIIDLRSAIIESFEDMPKTRHINIDSEDKRYEVDVDLETLPDFVQFAINTWAEMPSTNIGRQWGVSDGLVIRHRLFITGKPLTEEEKNMVKPGLSDNYVFSYQTENGYVPGEDGWFQIYVKDLNPSLYKGMARYFPPSNHKDEFVRLWNGDPKHFIEKYADSFNKAINKYEEELKELNKIAGRNAYAPWYLETKDRLRSVHPFIRKVFSEKLTDEFATVKFYTDPSYNGDRIKQQQAIEKLGKFYFEKAINEFNREIEGLKINLNEIKENPEIVYTTPLREEFAKNGETRWFENTNEIINYRNEQYLNERNKEAISKFISYIIMQSNQISTSSSLEDAARDLNLAEFTLDLMIMSRRPSKKVLNELTKSTLNSVEARNYIAENYLKSLEISGNKNYPQILVDGINNLRNESESIRSKINIKMEDLISAGPYQDINQISNFIHERYEMEKEYQDILFKRNQEGLNPISR